MKKNNKKAKSSLPTDAFTPSMGSNFGMDGFFHDMEYGEGTAEGGRLPEARGLSGLPDGLVEGAGEAESFDQFDIGFSDVDSMLEESAAGINYFVEDLNDEENGINLVAFLEDKGQDISSMPTLANLDWLSLQEDPNPNRLPQTPESIPELVQAWGVHRRTDGLGLAPQNRDFEILKIQGEVSKSAGGGPDIDGRQQKLALRDLVRKAARRVASGTSVQQAVDMVKWATGEESPAIEMLEDDHGLAGNIYIRASAYPGCQGGKWSKHTRKVASTARYVIGSRKCSGCVQNQKGRCGVFKKEVVASVPWNSAWEHYGRRFEARGIRLAGGSIKEALRSAFLTDAPVRAPRHQKHIQPHIADFISEEQASKAVRSKAARRVVEAPNRALQARREAAAKQISLWRKNGLLSKEEAHRIASSGASPREMVLVGTRLATATRKAAAYSGSGQQSWESEGVTRSDILAALEKNASAQAGRQQKLVAQGRQQAEKKIRQMVSGGLLSKKAGDYILALDKPGSTLLRIASRAVSEYGQQAHKAAFEAIEKQEYIGAGRWAEHDATSGVNLADATQHLRQASHEAHVSPHQIQGVLKWASRQMSEGSLGEELDQLLTTRFSEIVLKAAGGKLASLRAKHEGLAGHMYVRASAYASKEGTRGCDEGARKHRVNPLRYVLAMKRCGSCVFKNAEEQCQKYKKVLVSRKAMGRVASSQGEPLRDFQARMITEANSSDSERTASMFSDSHQSIVDEFGGLESQNMADFDFYDSQPVEKLGAILFGGPHMLGEE